MRSLRVFLALWAACLMCGAVSAQDESCDVPLVVTRFAPQTGTVELVADLTPKDFAIKIGKGSGTVTSASIDSGSKRIALILDASKNVPKDEWELETEMAVNLVENARALDRFALSLVGVDLPAGRFVPLGDVQTQLNDLAASRPIAVDGNERIYDALLAAAKRFDPPQFGDSIFLFGHPNDFGSQATEEQVEEAVLRNLLRFYAVSFTDPLSGKLPPHFDLNKPLPKSAIPGGADNISHATGYFFSYHSVSNLKLPGQLPLFQGFLGDLYTGIAQPYRLRITPSAMNKAGLELSVVNGQSRNIRQGDVHYPHFIYPCQSK